ncbi:hypothetical protein PR048_010230 [Dryococelus australis]|uniref:Uncharacterized protein n=1 Tax=Dryococelus australis TaxID=614101 RepID=A0ABQ9I2Z5_9NEOP|nr:hypothetical protein PR048_010230 [Dryococelus australis]
MKGRGKWEIPKNSLTRGIVWHHTQIWEVFRMLCDLIKAFHCVSHEILLDKLACYGISGIVLNTQSYLKDSKQLVTIMSAFSEALS